MELIVLYISFGVLAAWLLISNVMMAKEIEQLRKDIIDINGDLDRLDRRSQRLYDAYRKIRTRRSK